MLKKYGNYNLTVKPKYKFDCFNWSIFASKNIKKNLCEKRTIIISLLEKTM